MSIKQPDLQGYSACIEMLFVAESDNYAERIRLAANAGFGTIEFWLSSNKDIELIANAVAGAGVMVAGFVAEPGVALTDPLSHDAFLAGLARSRDTAVRLGASMLLIASGDTQAGVPREVQKAHVVSSLRRAADVMKGSGVLLALEPINTGERKDYFLPSTRDALDIVDEVGRPEVKLLYDMYHSAYMGETLQAVLAGRVDRIAHVHLADHPGRGEPGTGELRWREGLAWLRANGYAGKVGLEYKPTGGTVESLRFLA